MHSRSLLARAPVRNSLNLALPSGTRTCSQFTEYEYLPPPPPPLITSSLTYTHLHNSPDTILLRAHSRRSPEMEPLPPPPSPLTNFSSNLHDSRRSPILVSKRRISPKGEGFSCLYYERQQRNSTRRLCVSTSQYQRMLTCYLSGNFSGDGRGDDSLAVT